MCLLFALQDGATPLFKACHKGHIDVVQELMKYRPNLSLLQVGFTRCFCLILYRMLQIRVLILKYCMWSGDYCQQAELRTDGACRIMMMLEFLY